MKIDRNNYEAFFIDYLEGKLDEKLVDDFIEFLQQNTDLKEELSMFGPVSVHPENFTFNKKDKLYKEPFDLENEFNRAAVAKLECDLTEPEKTGFEAYLAKHPEKQKEAELFSKTKLIPDESILFNKKNKLYHKPAGKTVLLWTVRIAAALIMALVIYNLTNKQTDPLTEERKTAQAESEIQESENFADSEKPATEMTVKDETIHILAEVLNDEAAKPESTPVVQSQETIEKYDATENQIAGRIQVEIPVAMNPLQASLEIKTQPVYLASINYKAPETENQVNDERLLADVVKEKTGISNLTIGKIKKAGLNLVSGFTKENFSYETNEEGQITEISFDSRLLAFTIPTSNEKAGK